LPPTLERGSQKDLWGYLRVLTLKKTEIARNGPSQLVRTGFFDRLAFRPGEAPENAIAPDAVADAVIAMLNVPPGTVVDEINLSPLKKVIRFGPPAGT